MLVKRNLIVMSLMLALFAAACTNDPVSDADSSFVPTTDSEFGVPDDAVVFEAPARFREPGTDDGVAYVSPGTRVAAGGEIEIGMLSDRCTLPVLQLFFENDSPANPRLLWWLERWWATEATTGTLLTVAVPEDLPPNEYTLKLTCVDRAINDSMFLGFIVDPADGNSVPVTDENRPNIYCPAGVEDGECPIEDRAPPDANAN